MLTQHWPPRPRHCSHRCLFQTQTRPIHRQRRPGVRRHQRHPAGLAEGEGSGVGLGPLSRVHVSILSMRGCLGPAGAGWLDSSLDLSLCDRVLRVGRLHGGGRKRTGKEALGPWLDLLL